MHITQPIIILSSLTACSSQKSSSPYTTPSEESRDPRKADQLNARAADLLESLVKLQLRISKSDEMTERRLAEIAIRGETEQWQECARLQNARMDK